MLAELHRLLFFEPLPFISRIVFLATPHRGSDLSRGVVGRVSANLISDPDDIHKLLSQLVRDNPDAFGRRFRRFPTSIETLATDSPILTAIQAMKPDPRVVTHSIIGSERPVPKLQSTDGVVPYRSSHLDGVVSEKIVRSGHGVQRDGEAIQEVRRILHEHLTQPVIAEGPPTRRRRRSWKDSPRSAADRVQVVLFCIHGTVDGESISSPTSLRRRDASNGRPDRVFPEFRKANAGRSKKSGPGRRPCDVIE